MAIVTTLGACSGGLGGLGSQLAHRGRPDIIAVLNGILGGLVSITAGASYVEPYFGLVIGLLGGVLEYWSSQLLKV